jgi:NAD(P)-dependent dehydrogenase (short-subunit alcohol dehydrogenase family)
MAGLSGRVALVTGAGSESGIGFASALKLAQKGADIVITDLAEHKAALESRAAELTAATGVRALPVVCDVTDDVALQTCVDATMAEYGRIDVLFNNAGIGTIRDFEETEIDYFDLVYRINVRGPIALTKLVLPIMKTQRRGVIINNSSSAGVYGVRGMTHYCTSKHALIGFTKALASEVGRDGIRVLAVCPGLIDTEIYRKGLPDAGLDVEETMAALAQTASLGRFAGASEVGDFVAFAASDEASYLTGTYYHVHGGLPVDGLV